jgi:hypothetical protein
MIIVICQLSIAISFSQPTIQWEKSLGGTSEDSPGQIVQTLDGGYIIIGYSLSQDGDVTGPYNGTAWIVKLFPSGFIEWQKNYGGNHQDYPVSILQTLDGGFIVSGNTTSDTFEGVANKPGDAFVLKLNDTGAIQWFKCYSGSGFAQQHKDNTIVQTLDGGYLFSGSVNAFDSTLVDYHGGTDLWVVKLSDTGSIQWQRCYGGSNNEAYSTAMNKTNDGGYIITCDAFSTDGDVTGNHGGGDYWVLKIDSIGHILWEKCYGGSGWDVPYSIIQTLDDGYIVTGFAGSTDGDVTGNHGSNDYWVVKLSDTGAIQWENCFGGTGDDEAGCIIQNPDSTYIVAGLSLSADGNVTNNHGIGDDWIIKLNPLGHLIWEQCYGGSNDEATNCIIKTTDGGYAFAGYSYSNDGEVTGHHGSTAGDDYWVVKLNPDTTTGIKEITPSQGITIYPNPSINTITLHLDQLSPAFGGNELEITDVFGRLIYKETIHTNDTKIDVTNWNEGVYFYSLTPTLSKGERQVWRGKIIKE